MDQLGTPADWRKMLLAYRLNEVDEAQREEIDTRLITDEEFAAAMQEAEYDLLDAYAAGELTADERGRVEMALHPASRFSPARHGRVVVAATPIAIAAPVRSRVAKRHTLGWLAAAAVVAASFVTAWMVQRPKPAPQAASVQQAAPATSSRAVPPQASIASPGPSVTAPAARGGSPAVSAVATVLLAGALRSQDALAVSIAPRVKAVQFVWPAPADLTVGARYELQVVAADGAVSCRSDVVAHRETGGLRFLCPAASVATGASFVRVMELPLSPDTVPVLEVSLAVSRR